MTEFAGSEATTTTPGAALASARNRLGLTIADVAGQMRISPRQVEAIEADRYSELPGAVFVRGFMRNYARVLKLDPEPLLHALEPALGENAPLRAHVIAGTLPGPVRRGRTIGWLGALLVLVACVLGAGLYEYLRTRQQAIRTTSEIVPPAVDARVAAEPAPSPEPAAPQPAPAAEPPAAGAEREPGQAAADAETQQASAGAATAGAPAVPGTVRSSRLVVEFLRESWIEIRDRSGTVVYSGTGAAESRRSVDAEPPLTVVVGNVSGVRITYNERPVDVAPYAVRNIARFTLE